MRIAFKTFGCRTNSVDTDILMFEAQRRGYTIVDEREVADAYVINSCTVTHQADRETRYQVNRFRRKNPCATVAIVGCYSQIAKEELLKHSGVDLLIGTADKLKIFELLEEGLAFQRDRVLIPSGFLSQNFSGSRYARANIKIQDGCNFKCSFCIIPFARGRSQSLPESVVLKQIEDAYAQGFNEIILTGIHLAHYGWDCNSSLMALLKSASKKSKGPRIRLSTLDPFEIPDELIRMLGEEERLCTHFHIALQSGSNRVLQRMRRIYKAEEFVQVTSKIKNQRKDTFIGVDIIVGFPGEGVAEFNETLACLDRSPWTKLHVFPFSLRKGTAAEKLDGFVSPSEIKRRVLQLLQMSAERYEDFLRGQVDTVHKLLLERMHPEFLWMGHTENYLPIYMKYRAGQVKAVLSCRITHMDSGKLWAQPLTVH